jgi:hypothetical protein
VATVAGVDVEIGQVVEFVKLGIGVGVEEVELEVELKSIGAGDEGIDEAVEFAVIGIGAADEVECEDFWVVEDNGEEVKEEPARVLEPETPADEGVLVEFPDPVPVEIALPGVKDEPCRGAVAAEMTLPGVGAPEESVDTICPFGAEQGHK